MNTMLKYNELLTMIRRQTEPQRILLVFAKRQSREAQEAREEQVSLTEKPDFTITPVMYVDKMPDKIGNFSKLVTDSSKTGKNWDLVFISGVKGRNGEPPNDFETDFRMEGMVKSIQHGQIQNLLVYNRKGEPVNLFQTPD